LRCVPFASGACSVAAWLADPPTGLRSWRAGAAPSFGELGAAIAFPAAGGCTIRPG